MSARIRFARLILPKWCVVIFREDLDEATRAIFLGLDGVRGFQAPTLWMTRIVACLERAEWRCR
jgi:hypothetical protein